LVCCRNSIWDIGSASIKFSLSFRLTLSHVSRRPLALIEQLHACMLADLLSRAIVSYHDPARPAQNSILLSLLEVEAASLA
jgi:hypothetical protein